MPTPPDPQMLALAQTLGNIRDSWVQISIALKDHVAQAPSPAQDEVMRYVQAHLARIRERERRDFE